ncbi:hypothetical protein C8F04DRAFT_1406160 [Mycena alexandri]|uniref:F-box domain-containing protein n=1 Tax=Mycena alexandri TaxID=1745969 RepID=A0AAD6RZG6_9AGAR|nr:hypothetical protein C8F04DRAFT_1406160 [Mycena alexandri]
MSLTNTPLDVLIEISRELDLSDSIHLISTCSTFTPILLSRYFWISALDRVEHVHRRPLPCYPGLDITSLPLDALKKMAIYAYTLQKNWTAESPRPVRVESIITMRDYSKEIIPIQGTRLIITSSASRLACWDTTSGECVAAFNHDGITAFSYLPSNYHFLRPGSCSIGIVYQSPPVNALELAVIRFDYGSSSTVTVSKVFSKIWTAPDAENYRVCDVTVNENTVAVVLASLVPEKEGLILLCKLADDGIVHRVASGITPDAGSLDLCMPSDVRCLIVEDGVYLTRHRPFDLVAEIAHFRTWTTELGNPEYVIVQGDIRFPRYGVLQITSRTDFDDDFVPEGELYSLHFWLAEYDGSAIIPGPLLLYDPPYKIGGVAVGSSATCAIFEYERLARP